MSTRLGDLVESLGGELIGDPDIAIIGIAPLDAATASHITFLSNPKLRAQASVTRAGALVLSSTEHPVVSEAYKGVCNHLHGNQTTSSIGQHIRQKARLAGCPRNEPSHAGRALHHRIVSRLLGVATILSKAKHAAVNDVRLDCANFVIRKLHARHRIGTHVPSDHVCIFEQAHQRGMAIRVFEVETDRTLVAVEMQKFGRHAGRATTPAQVPSHIPFRAFDFDHFSAMVREDLRTERADHYRGQVDHLDAGQHAARAARLLACFSLVCVAC